MILVVNKVNDYQLKRWWFYKTDNDLSIFFGLQQIDINEVLRLLWIQILLVFLNDLNKECT